MAKKKQEQRYEFIGGYRVQVIGSTMRYCGVDVACLLDPVHQEFLDWIVQADSALRNAPLLSGIRNTEEWQAFPEASISRIED